MTEKAEAWDAILQQLQGQHRLRVWSVIITVFGDAIVPRGGTIPLQALQEIMNRLGIEAGAVRTALSRLASEGWVIRERQGRLSHYSLDKRGRRAFDEATQRIYASGPPQWDGHWTVAVPVGESANGTKALEAAGFLSRGGVWIRPDVVGTAKVPESLGGFLFIDGTAATIPPEAHRLWSMEGVAAALREFRRSVEPLARALEGGATPAPLDALAARTLLIHEWRRIILRAPMLPAELLPPGWPWREVRGELRDVYRQLAEPSEKWLSQADLPPLRNSAAFAARFGGG
jgi:phenylacetic acid degradation operon negative regulatory protein